MKTFIALILLAGFTTVSCYKNEKPSTAPADYAETYEDLIQNPGNDSVARDSATTDSAKATSGEPMRKDSAK